MKQITTKSGFCAEVDEERSDDWELFNMICEIEGKHDLRRLYEAIEIMLGEDDAKRMIEHVKEKSETGRAKLTAVVVEFFDILGQLEKK